MTLFSKYSYRADFCAFRKQVLDMLAEAESRPAEATPLYLWVSPHLELKLVAGDALSALDGGDLYPLRSLMLPSYTSESAADFADILSGIYIIGVGANCMDKEDIINASVMVFHRLGYFPAALEPYFRWKQGDIACEDITREQLWNMVDVAEELVEELEEKHPDGHDLRDCFVSDDPWQFTRGFEEDKYKVACLHYIVDQLEDIRLRIW